MDFDITMITAIFTCTLTEVWCILDNFNPWILTKSSFTFFILILHVYIHTSMKNVMKIFFFMILHAMCTHLGNKTYISHISTRKYTTFHHSYIPLSVIQNHTACICRSSIDWAASWFGFLRSCREGCRCENPWCASSVAPRSVRCSHNAGRHARSDCSYAHWNGTAIFLKPYRQNDTLECMMPIW